MVCKNEIKKIAPVDTSLFDTNIQPVIYTFQNVSCTYGAKKTKNPKTGKQEDKGGKMVLDDVSGVLASGWLVAIMGPSGMYVYVYIYVDQST